MMLMKNIVISIINLLRNIVGFVYFLLGFVYHKGFLNLNPLKQRYSGSAVVLANGPSLKEVIPLLDKEERFKNTDFVVLNYFAFDEIFFKIKPKHYCLSDPLFFSTSSDEHNTLRLFQILDSRVNWNLNIYIPAYGYIKFKQYSKITNAHIRIIGLNTDVYTGFKRFSFFLYKKYCAMPPIWSVIIMAIFTAINSGYSTLYLYGVDHTFFDSLYVNDDNILCNKYTHFYDKETIVEYKPIMDVPGKYLRTSEYLYGKTLIFKSHDILAEYAKYRNVSVINCTQNSLIDSYKRIKNP
jgi:hypothetical protein